MLIINYFHRDLMNYIGRCSAHMLIRLRARDDATASGRRVNARRLRGADDVCECKRYFLWSSLHKGLAPEWVNKKDRQLPPPFRTGHWDGNVRKLRISCGTQSFPDIRHCCVKCVSQYLKRFRDEAMAGTIAYKANLNCPLVEWVLISLHVTFHHFPQTSSTTDLGVVCDVA